MESQPQILYSGIILKTFTHVGTHIYNVCVFNIKYNVSRRWFLENVFDYRADEWVHRSYK